MICPDKKQCSDFHNEMCKGELPNKVGLHTCKMGIERLIEKVKPYGCNVDKHEHEKMLRKLKSKNKKKKGKSKFHRLTMKEIRRAKQYENREKGIKPKGA